ncbi:hypothetical protein [Prauserella endophytica]|uniref:DUF222 domain-containing protein n=1 Tax=Prauserella endophytica TaxID=1592324 RepID=A0ABY2RZF8_9PSEU|nr:hypothetical protein [Prauserella endophytica]TKG66271.1 hypothetical protein FCN18_25915 [Prauserella endophytica]
MTDGGEAGHVRESDAELERALGTRDALLALWNPSGRPVSVSWDDSSIVTADDRTRSRLTEAHSVVHALLRGEHASAMQRLADMSSLMAVFTALRSVTLASELLWSVPLPTWQTVLTDAQAQTKAVIVNDADEAQAGADALARAIRRNLAGDRRQRILDCVAETATAQSRRARLGLGGFGAAVLAAALKTTSNGRPSELAEEHAALIVALAHGQTVTHRDGRLVVDG